MEAVRRLFSIQRQLRTVDSALQYQGMASDVRQRLDVTSKYEMNSGCRIPVLGYGVCALPACLAMLCLSLIRSSTFIFPLLQVLDMLQPLFFKTNTHMSAVMFSPRLTTQETDKFVLPLQVYQT